MKKLILLNEVREEKNGSKLLTFSKFKDEEDNYNISNSTFEEKFDCLQDKEESNNVSNRSEGNISKILERIFALSNYILIINFINSIYNDALSLNTEIRCIKNTESVTQNGSNNYIRIFAQDEYRKFEYKIRIQSVDEDNLAMLMSKKDLTNNKDYNIINFSKKKKEYENCNSNDNDTKESYDKCLIVLSSNVEVPDEYEFKSDFNGQNIEHKVKIIKGWKYGFKQLFEKNMYLLFPLKVIDLRKRLLDINFESSPKDLINDEILLFFKEMNRYLKRIKDIDLITDKDINEINLVAIDLLNSLIKEENSILMDMKVDIKATIKDIVVWCLTNIVYHQIVANDWG